VCFDLLQNRQGWRALELLAWALLLDDVTMVAWCSDDEPSPGSLAFEIRGTNGADPDLAADAIYDTMCVCEERRREHTRMFRCETS
jgi:hypothetical protein